MTITYLIDRFLLHKAGQVLQPPEQVRFATGIALTTNIVVLQHLLKLKAKTGVTHAEPDPASIARLQNLAWDLGVDLHAQFHSHPGNDANATYPSGTDLDTARRWENGPTPFLGAIFSSNGRYVRFFNHDQHSTIHIIGAHYEQLDEYLFELHDPTVQPAEATLGAGDGPTRTTELVATGTDQER